MGAISVLIERPSQLVRRSAIALDVDVFEEFTRFCEALFVGQDVVLVRKSATGKLEWPVEFIAALFENPAGRIGAQERRDRGIVIFSLTPTSKPFVVLRAKP